MNEYVLSCSSTADLTLEHFRAHRIEHICFHYTLDGKSYLDDLGESIPFDEFYRRMAEGASTSTSQISMGEYIDYFTRFLESGKDILHVSLSSGISGTYNSAQAAADELRERYPERKIYIMDSLAASSGYGLFMCALASLRDEGLDIDALYNWGLANRLRVHHWFFSTDLTRYILGGRISKTAGFIGSVLQICPLLNVDNQGRLIVREKIRTKRRVINAIVEKMKEFADDGADYSGPCYISNSACQEDALAVAGLIEEYFPKLRGKVRIFSVGTTIGSHTGPGTVALFFFGSERKN